METKPEKEPGATKPGKELEEKTAGTKNGNGDLSCKCTSGGSTSSIVLVQVGNDRSTNDRNEFTGKECTCSDGKNYGSMSIATGEDLGKWAKETMDILKQRSMDTGKMMAVETGSLLRRANRLLDF
jgi:hypothetical protein